MLVIGVVGGVACGKSLVARQFERLGAGVLNADLAGHEALRHDEVKEAIRAHWGESVLDAHGEVDRSRVARIVFAPLPEGPRELARLEQITHPVIEQILRRRLDEFRQQGVAAVVLDAAVLLKAGWDRLCDAVVFVDAPAERRIAWAAQRGWSEADWAAREAAQTPLDEKRRRADLIIDNSGTPDQTRIQVENAWKTLLSPSHDRLRQ
jgi:dephospho-CoA kinase